MSKIESDLMCEAMKNDGTLRTDLITVTAGGFGGAGGIYGYGNEGGVCVNINTGDSRTILQIYNENGTELVRISQTNASDGVQRVKTIKLKEL